MGAMFFLGSPNLWKSIKNKKQFQFAENYGVIPLRPSLHIDNIGIYKSFKMVK